MIEHEGFNKKTPDDEWLVNIISLYNMIHNNYLFYDIPVQEHMCIIKVVDRISLMETRK